MLKFFPVAPEQLETGHGTVRDFEHYIHPWAIYIKFKQDWFNCSQKAALGLNRTGAGLKRTEQDLA